MSIKQASRIEVGLADGRPGFTIEYTDGERAHFIFHRGIARQLAERLSCLVAELDYLDRQLSSGAPGDRIGISDHAQVRLTPPSGGSLGIGAGDGVTATD